jgi:hypothetical protein
MEKKQKSLALAGAGIAAAAVLGLTGAGLASAAAGSETALVVSGTTQPSAGTTTEGTGQLRPGRMHDAGGTLTADAASKAVAAAGAEVDGGTVNGVRALSDGGYVVHVTKSDGTHVHVLLDKDFAVTSTQEGGMGRGGRPGAPERDGKEEDDSTDEGTESSNSTTSLRAI